jgi:hypothetical protein
MDGWCEQWGFTWIDAGEWLLIRAAMQLGLDRCLVEAAHEKRESVSTMNSTRN